MANNPFSPLGLHSLGDRPRLARAATTTAKTPNTKVPRSQATFIVDEKGTVYSADYLYRYRPPYQNEIPLQHIPFDYKSLPEWKKAEKAALDKAAADGAALLLGLAVFLVWGVKYLFF